MDPARERILLIIEDASGLGDLRHALAEEYKILTAAAATVIVAARSTVPERILLSAAATDTSGVQSYRRLKADAELCHIPVLCIAPGSDITALTGRLSVAAADCIARPFIDAELRLRVAAHIRIGHLQRQLAETQQKLVSKEQELADKVARILALTERDRFSPGERRGRDRDFIGQSPALQATLDAVGRMQQSAIPVLITGESGTGKELIARALHFGGSRADGPFLPVNCSVVPEELAESLFFGHVRGAFSGADANRPGLFELAHGGTLFLDEVGDMSLGPHPACGCLARAGGRCARCGGDERRPDELGRERALPQGSLLPSGALPPAPAGPARTP